VLDDGPPPGWQERERLAALRDYCVLDTPSEPEFDDLAQVAARVCQTPIAAINLIEDHRQWFKAEIGLGVRQMPLDVSICASAILQPGLFVVPDLSQDSRFDGNPLVAGEPKLRFYAGALLETREGLPLGTLCVLDHVPRRLTEDQAFVLQALARQVMSQLELRRAVVEREKLLAASRAAGERQALLVRELHHRVRNSLATVQAMLGATARTTGSVGEFYQSFSARISSLANTQTLLTEDYWQTAPLRDLILKELQPFDHNNHSHCVLNGPVVEISADLAVPLGMALHELATNAVRFGALSVPSGHVEVTWNLSTLEGVRTIKLQWQERGGPALHPPQHEGFGSTLLRRVLPMQTKANVEVVFDGAGLCCRIEAPLVESRLVPTY
jgi:two-component sensor histidine kinase